MKRAFFGLAATIGIALAIALIAEAYAQLAIPSPYRLDPEFGWRLKADFRHIYRKENAAGGRYTVQFATDRHGARTFGENTAGAVKVLVVGDSFTADPYAGNREMWYAVFSSLLEARVGRPVFVVASGAGGYGSFQELLVVRRLAPIVNPDLLIVQFCSNDFMNNHREWETSGRTRTQYMRRPYYTASGPQYHASALAWIYRAPWVGESRVLNKMDGFVQRAQRWLLGDASLQPASIRRHEGEAVRLTTELLRLIRREVEGRPAVMVNCDSSDDGPNRLWMRVAQDAGFVPVRAPSDAIARAQRERAAAFHEDGHWNGLGNRIFGEALFENLPDEVVSGLSAPRRGASGAPAGSR